MPHKHKRKPMSKSPARQAAAGIPSSRGTNVDHTRGLRCSSVLENRARRKDYTARCKKTGRHKLCTRTEQRTAAYLVPEGALKHVRYGLHAAVGVGREPRGRRHPKLVEQQKWVQVGQRRRADAPPHPRPVPLALFPRHDHLGNAAARGGRRRPSRRHADGGSDAGGRGGGGGSTAGNWGRCRACGQPGT